MCKHQSIQQIQRIDKEERGGGGTWTRAGGGRTCVPLNASSVPVQCILREMAFCRLPDGGGHVDVCGDFRRGSLLLSLLVDL